MVATDKEMGRSFISRLAGMRHHTRSAKSAFGRKVEIWQSTDVGTDVS